MGGYKTLDSLDGECTHVIQTRQEYEMLLNQRDRAKREKEAMCLKYHLHIPRSFIFSNCSSLYASLHPILLSGSRTAH